MKRIAKYIAVLFVILLEVVLVSCSVAPDLIMPCWIDEKAISYAGYNTPGLLPYTTIYDARQVLKAVSLAHLLNQRELVRDIEDDKLSHDYLFEAQSLHVARSEEWKEAVFDPAGPIGLMLTAAGVGTLGLFIPKPGTRKRLDNARAEGVIEGKNGG